MASFFEQAKFTGIANVAPAVVSVRSEVYEAIYEENRRRIYALSFWMTDNELAAEDLMRNTFCRAFSRSATPTPELIDDALVTEIREAMPLGSLTLAEGVCTETAGVRRNTLRVHLERAVVQLPGTERMVFLLHDVENYGHDRVSKLLGITEDESRNGLHQARLRMRTLIADMPR